jgi:putative transposase
VIETIRQGLKQDGYTVSISQLCRWFEVPRRTVYYRPTCKPPAVQERFSQPIKQMIEEDPSFGYRTVAHLLDFNKNTVQRIFQLMRWQVKKRPVGFRPRVQAMPSRAAVPNERWATDLCRVWSERDGWAMDCHSLELLGWHLSRSGRSKTAESALEQALIARFGTLGRVPKSFLLHSDNGLVFTSRSHTALVRGYGLRQEFITPHSPEQKELPAYCTLSVHWSDGSLGNCGSAEPFRAIMPVLDWGVRTRRLEQMRAFIVVSMGGQQARAAPELNRTHGDVEPFCDLGLG